MNPAWKDGISSSNVGIVVWNYRGIKMKAGIDCLRYHLAESLADMCSYVFTGNGGFTRDNSCPCFVQRAKNRKGMGWLRQLQL